MTLSPSSRAALLVAISATVAAIVVAAHPQSGSAQQNDDAATVAGAVQAFYNQTKGVRTSFYQTYFNKLYDNYDRSRGTVTFAKPGKMRWDYARPNGKVIATDGSTLTMYSPGDEGENGQCFRRQMSQSQLPAAFSFLTGTGRLEEDYTFRLLDAARQGYDEGYVLELTPRTPSPHYERILFYVMKRNDRPTGVVRRVLIVDAAGNRNRFDFSNMEWNPATTGATFRFSPPGGVRCVRP